MGKSALRTYISLLLAALYGILRKAVAIPFNTSIFKYSRRGEYLAIDIREEGDRRRVAGLSAQSQSAARRGTQSEPRRGFWFMPPTSGGSHMRVLTRSLDVG